MNVKIIMSDQEAKIEDTENNKKIDTKLEHDPVAYYEHMFRKRYTMEDEDYKVWNYFSLNAYIWLIR